MSGDFTVEDFQLDDSLMSDDLSETYKFKRNKAKYMRATNAFEIALEICAFARFLIKRIRYELFRNRTCDGFFRIFQLLLKKESEERIKGEEIVKSLELQLANQKQIDTRGCVH